MQKTSAGVLIPRETLFGNPDRVQPRLSPDGRFLAYIAPDEGVLNVWIRTAGADDDRPLTRDRGRGILSHFWAQNSEQVLYIQDRDGDENYHLYAVPVSGGEAVDLTPREGIQARVIARERSLPDDILVGVNDRDPQLHDVYRINTRTGEMALVAENDIGAVYWRADHNLEVRIAEISNPDGGFTLRHRSGGSEPWVDILSWGSEDGWSTSVVGFREDNRTLYLISSIGSDTAELRSFDILSRRETVLSRHETADASEILIHPRTHEAQAIAFYAERRDWKVLDETVRADFEAISAIHDGDFNIVSRDERDESWIVAYTQDRGPVVFYDYSRRTRKGTFLFSHRPALEDLPLAEMTPVSYRARDGLTIHGYLSLPPDLEPRNLPAVINVHGGPWHRDTWGFHPEAQWLANRGYACLQINFRGSTGYGKRFINAGDREWGGHMQDDISDGVRWLIDQGIADPQRTGIYGGSYGGFAVLSGLTKTPELYACGVDVVGPSNLITFIQTIPPYWKPLQSVFKKRVGDVEKDREFLESRSPLFHVDRIRAPLLIAQGANDPRVKRAESLQIVDALRDNGKTVEYIEFADEGHGFARPKNRLHFYAVAEKFLAEHLGGRYEP